MDMKETVIQGIKAALAAAVSAGDLPDGEYPDVLLEVPPQKEFGDFATNIAMQSARIAHKSPRMIGDILLKQYGQAPLRAEDTVQVEYVSANPTGPLHVGHGRGAAYGSALVNLLRAAGYNVQSEYYINDAGNQMNNLAASVNARYLELFGKKAEIPENGYHGADIIDTARAIIEQDGDKYLQMDEKDRLEIFKNRAYEEKLKALKRDLESFNVTFDKWFSERTLHPEAIKKACETLKINGVRG